MMRWLIETVALLLIGLVFFVFMVGLTTPIPIETQGFVPDPNVPEGLSIQTQEDIDDIRWKLKSQQSMLEQSVHMAKEK